MAASFDSAFLHELVKHGVAYHDETDSLTFGLRFTENSDLVLATSVAQSPCGAIALHELPGVPGYVGVSIWTVSFFIIEYWNCNIVKGCPACFVGDLLSVFLSDSELWNEAPQSDLPVIHHLHEKARKIIEQVEVIPEEILE
jgi:hypothetical protein